MLTWFCLMVGGVAASIAGVVWLTEVRHQSKLWVLPVALAVLVLAALCIFMAMPVLSEPLWPQVLKQNNLQGETR